MAEVTLTQHKKNKKPSKRQVNAELEKLVELLFSEFQNYQLNGGAK